MSEVTLHGYPVKVGDRVWDYEIGYGEVVRLIEKELFCVCFGGLDYCFYSSNGEFVRSEHSHGIGFVRLFWQPIYPSAIEAAKVKPEPVEYEWQWLYVDMDGFWETSGYFKEKPILHEKHKLVSRIEESKRGVKP